MITFGPYRIDPASGRLLRANANVPVRRKTFALLEYLVSRPGRLLSRDELLDAVWPGTHVTPSVLAGCIRELRRALGDHARAAKFIETAYGRGYRFIAVPIASPPPIEAALRRTLRHHALPASDPELAALARRFAEAVVSVLSREGRS